MESFKRSPRGTRQNLSVFQFLYILMWCPAWVNPYLPNCWWNNRTDNTSSKHRHQNINTSKCTNSTSYLVHSDDDTLRDETSGRMSSQPTGKVSKMQRRRELGNAYQETEIKAETQAENHAYHHLRKQTSISKSGSAVTKPYTRQHNPAIWGCEYESYFPTLAETRCEEK